MAKPSDDDIRFRVMRALEANPQLSQTPRGVLERARLTKNFLQRRMAEHEALRAEIAALQEELGAENAGQGARCE